MAAQRIHIIGIGGSGASAVARYLHEIGFDVTGSDNDRERTLELRQLGLKIATSHDMENIQQHDLVLTTPGLFDADREIDAAKKQKIPVLTWQEFLGRYLARRPGRGFMIAGTFGKGSTAAIVAHILEAAYLDPLAILGVEDVAWKSNLRLGFGEFWVMEADEFNRNFQHYRPAYAALTSLEHEHVSTYPTFDEYRSGFRDFFTGMADPKIVVVKRTPSIDESIPRLLPDKPVTYSIDDDADVRGTAVEMNADGSVFELHAPTFGLTGKRIELRVPGRIHVENAVGAAALALAAGVDFAAVNAGISTFRGLRRRFEVVRDGPRVTIFDYAHTPDRMRPVIREARQLFPGRRVVVLFEPHLYSRTKQLRDGFRDVLAEADRAYVVDIFPSREARSDIGKEIHSRDLIPDGNDRIVYSGSLVDGIAAVKAARTERDVVLVLGAGPIQKQAELLKT